RHRGSSPQQPGEFSHQGGAFPYRGEFPASGRSVSASRCVDRRMCGLPSVMRELSALLRRTLCDPPCPRAPAVPETATNVVKHLSGETADPALTPEEPHPCPKDGP